MALVLASITLDRGGSVPLLPRRGLDQSWQGGRDCLARYIGGGGGSGVRGCGWGGERSRSTGVGLSGVKELVVDQTVVGWTREPGPARA